jgi:hypothetical protein
LSGREASLVLGLADEDRLRLAAARSDGSVFDGLVALTARRNGWMTFATPFHDGPSLEQHVAAPAAALCVVRPTAAAPRRLGPSTAVAALSPRLCVVDRRVPALGRMLDASVRLVSTVPCYEVPSLADVPVESHAGALA